MHNPHLVVALGVFMAVLFVAMAIGMGVTMKTKSDKDVKKRRIEAASISGSLAFIVTLIYAVMAREKAGTASYMATMSILFFGLWYTIYMIVPKIYPRTCTPKSNDTHTVTIASHAAALGAGLLAYGLAWKFMKPM